MRARSQLNTACLFGAMVLAFLANNAAAEDLRQTGTMKPRQPLSPLRADLNHWLIEQYRGCWHYFGLGATKAYVPIVKVEMARNGSMVGEPLLINPPPDPTLRGLADSAIRAVHTCNPLAIPDRFKPYYDSWRTQTIRFDPKELS